MTVPGETSTVVPDAHGHPGGQPARRLRIAKVLR